MKPIKSILYFAAFAAATSFVTRSFAQEEQPIPDFGPAGPAGIEKRGLRGGGPPGADNQRRRSMEQRRAIEPVIMRRALQRLDLTDEQHETIRSIFAQYDKEGKVHRKNLKTAGESLKTAQETVPVDKTAVQAAKDAIASVRKQTSVHIAEVRSSVLNVLTLEQEERLYKLVDNMRERSEKRGSKKPQS